MKKVFLSLAALAFVATGSLTMTSCGGDDDSSPAVPGTPGTPGEPGEPGNPGTPITANNSFVYDGENYVLDGSTFVINSLNPDAEDAAPNYASYSYEEGDDAPSYVVSEWYVDAYPEFAQGQQPDYFLRIYFDVEAGTNDQGQPILATPSQAENIFPYQVVTVQNGTTSTNSQYAYGDIDLNFSVFSISGNTLTAAYNGADNLNEVSFDYNSEAGLFLDDWNVPTEGGKSASKVVKARKNHLNNVTSAKVIKK